MHLKSGRATIKEVASAAGVSTQTVSRVINNRPDVSPETRKRVQEIIDQLGYQPSALARSLIRQRSYTLGVVTAGLTYTGPSRTLSGITRAAERAGYSLLLKDGLEFNQVVEQVCKSPSTISLYLSQLVDENIVKVILEDRKKTYHLVNRQLVDQLIEDYQPGLLEKHSSGFEDIINSL